MATMAAPAPGLSSGEAWKDMLEEILPPRGGGSEEESRVLTDHRNRLAEFTEGFLEILPGLTGRQ